MHVCAARWLCLSHLPDITIRIGTAIEGHNAPAINMEDLHTGQQYKQREETAVWRIALSLSLSLALCVTCIALLAYRPLGN